jgi:charged multivesicular body protein 4A/B
MSGWLSYFSGPRDTKTTTRQAIVGIREQLSMLDKKEEHLEKKIEEELKKAKANATTNKAGKPLTLTSSHILGISCSLLPPENKN